jgi:hypothetical protein
MCSQQSQALAAAEQGSSGLGTSSASVCGPCAPADHWSALGMQKGASVQTMFPLPSEKAGALVTTKRIVFL